MGGIDVVLELVLVGLLGFTLLHAVRLQRALAALREDRTAFDAAVSGFDGGARQAEAGLLRLREATERLEAQLRTSGALKDDLVFLSERGERLADQLETLVRSGRGLGTAPAAPEPPATPVRSQAERSLLLALQGRR